MSGLGLPMVLWAGRDVLRRPGVAVLFGVCLAALTVVTAVPLLLTQAVDDTARELLADSPSLVVRRVDAGGWRPIPAAEASERAAQVIGVTAARPRIWGVVAGPGGPVTLLAVPPSRELDEAVPSGGVLPRQWLDILSPGKAVVGPALADLKGGQLELRGVTTLQLDVVGTMEPDASMAVHDVVLVSPSDARPLLGLAPGEASDLAIQVFHDNEEEAIVPDLIEAFPWPVHIRRRSETLDGYTAGLGRRGSLAMLTLTPALLGLVLLVVAAWRDGLANRREVGLLKALGWTTGDVVRLRLWRAAIVGVPAVVLGLVLAYELVFWPGASWLGEVLLGWPQRPVLLTLQPGSAALLLFEVSALVLLPWFAAALWPALRTATSQPERHLAEDQG